MSKLNFNQVQKIKSTPQSRFKTGQTVATPTVRTENNAVAYNTTGHKLSDFFSRFGAMRSSSEQEILATFQDLYEVMPKEAVKLLMFFRDCRGGQGERRVFDVVYNWFIKTNNPLAYQLLTFVPEMGYWKDVRDSMVYAATVRNTNFLDFACAIFVGQLYTDTKAKNMSLAAKYAPTENWARKNDTHEQVFKRFMLAVRDILKIKDRQTYRKLISLMRSTLNVVETQMSAQQWESIDFAAVPSKAHNLYRKAFGKHQQTRYAAYLAKLVKGETKINASVLTPFDVAKKYLTPTGRVYKYDETLEQLWKALPNYVQHDVLAISDTSSSMDGDPMLMSVALGVYFAQRSTGAFKNEVVSFNSNPEFIDLSKCKSLYEAFQAMARISWGGSTNLHKAFEKLLQTAVKNKATNEDLPKFLIILSDMQMDRACGQVPFDAIRKDFAKHNFSVPTTIFWNLRASESKNFPVANSDNVIQVSGCSPAVLQFVLSTISGNSLQVIYDIINNPRYAFVDNLEVWNSE